jgi:hypothetical protein
MAIILPQRWTRQPQYRVALDPRWVELGLNLALLPQGNNFVDCSARNRQGSGGVRTQSTSGQGRTVLRTSGNYAFRGLMQNATTFSLIAVVKPTNIVNEGVISISASASVTEAIQFTIRDSQIELICANSFVVATSANSGLVANRTHVIGLTYNQTASQVIFYCDGKQLNTAAVSAPTFVVDGSGLLFVKQSGSEPYTGGLALHLDFATTLKPEHMIALTANPWQVFSPQKPLYLAVAGGAVSHAATGALIGGGSVIVGSAAHIAKHAATGTLAGGGAVIVGAASSKTTRAATGVLVGQGAVVAGTAARIRIHPSSGTLTGQGAVVVGSAARTRQHPATGVLQAGGAVIVGEAERTGSASTHEATGQLIGDGALLIGAANLTSAAVEETYSGGYSSWNPAYLLNRKHKELAQADLPKAVKKAIKQVAQLNLTETEAEVALRLRTQDIAWQQQFFEYSMALQQAMQAANIHEANKLHDRLRQGAALAQQQRIAAQIERDRRIQIIMQLI